VLKVGCGTGNLARAVDATGYHIVAVDPEAPEWPIFRRMKLEQLDDGGPFQAAVASYSLHHVETYGAALDQSSACWSPTEAR